MNRKLARALLMTLGALVMVFAIPQAAAAHPLGNFTVNRYARVEPAADVIRITYVLDQAEIPTFQEQKTINANSDAFAQKRADDIAAGLKLSVDGQQLPLTRKQYLLSEPTGQGGLPVLRLAVIYEAPAPAAGSLHDAVFEDSNQPDRIGWREIIVRAQGNASVTGSNAPVKDLSDELRSYPANLIQAPLDLRKATFRFDPGTISVPAEHLISPTKAPVRADAGFSGLVRKVDPGPVALALIFLLAVGFGAVHGLAPGHGKSVMAAYLVGTRGRPADAVLLGVLVAIMHTGSVLIVGLVLLKIGSATDIAKVYPVLTLLSGVIVLLLGSALVATRLRSLRRARTNAPAFEHHDHDHSHAEPHHHHDDHHEHEHVHASTEGLGVHSHGLGKSHSHELPEGVAPLSRRGIILLATSGGLLPSPSAVIVLIGASSTGRLALGLGLIGAFSVGLAAMLTAIGLALVYGRGFLERRESGAATFALRVLPVASACALFVAGAVVTVEGVNGL